MFSILGCLWTLASAVEGCLQSKVYDVAANYPASHLATTIISFLRKSVNLATLFVPGMQATIVQ